jgi:hypothetical protein
LYFLTVGIKSSGLKGELMDFDTNPLDEDLPLRGVNRIPGNDTTNSAPARIAMRALRQKPYFILIDRFQKLFYDLPDISVKEVDAQVREMYDVLMEACEGVGISRISIPQLKECCGKKRVWKDEPKGLRIGDKIAWLFDKLGIKKCEGCKKRQEALNKIRLPGS